MCQVHLNSYDIEMRPLDGYRFIVDFRLLEANSAHHITVGPYLLGSSEVALLEVFVSVLYNYQYNFYFSDADYYPKYPGLLLDSWQPQICYNHDFS